MGRFIKTGELPLLTSDNIKCSHGFSTREGGVSHGDGLDTLDLGMGEERDVTENRRRFASSLGADISRMFSAKQIHSNIVETVTESDLGRKFECDGFVTSERGLLLTVKGIFQQGFLVGMQCGSVTGGSGFRLGADRGRRCVGSLHGCRLTGGGGRYFRLLGNCGGLGRGDG